MRVLVPCTAVVLLCQCSTLVDDCPALAQREAEIARETPGDYYVGRRYYLPYTRFWGYLRKPGESWRNAKLVIMDESVVRNPDRGYEPPVKGAIFGFDQNYEYFLSGSYTGEMAYDPSTDQILPVFRPTQFTVRDKKPGFLFVPSEKYVSDYVTIRPLLIPNPESCRQAMAE